MSSGMSSSGKSGAMYVGTGTATSGSGGSIYVTVGCGNRYFYMS